MQTVASMQLHMLSSPVVQPFCIPAHKRARGLSCSGGPAVIAVKAAVLLLLALFEDTHSFSV